MINNNQKNYPTSSQKYNVVLHIVGGGFQILSAHGRTEWVLPTANKHGVDIKKAIDDQKAPWWPKYKNVELSPADHDAPCMPLKLSKSDEN